jgi:hypothetical protein
MKALIENIWMVYFRSEPKKTGGRIFDTPPCDSPSKY